MFSNEEIREMTRTGLIREFNNIIENYMDIYDEYYSENSSNDSAFLHDLVDSIKGVSAVLKVYNRDKKIHPNYAIEKLRWSKSYIDSCIEFYKTKEDYIKED